MKKLIITMIVVGVTLLSYFLLKNQKAQELSTSVSVQPTQEVSSQTPKPTESTSASPVPLVQQNTVIYNNSGYSPAILMIKVGTSVTFKNNSTHSMWTASNDHLTHRLYPESGGCIGSKFDACKGIMPGESWTFKFVIAGAWKYHNHLEPGDTGTIVVQ